MRVEVEDISSVEKKITVTIPKESVITEFENAYRNLKKRVAVKGFRQGKVPRDLLERHYKKEVEGEVVTKLINDSCFKSLEENGITPVSPPVIDNGVLEEGKEFTYSAKIEVKPEIEVKGYIGMELEKEKLSISNEDIEKKLAEL
ncbi:MAG: trigger factor family protein, partial [Pseudomonadota bacterium]